MRLARCEKGHYYDKDKFTTCPHCSGMQVAPGETVAYADPNAKTEMPDSIKPKVEVEDRVPFDPPKNMYSTEELSKNEEAKMYTEEIDPMAESTLNKKETAAEEEKTDAFSNSTPKNDKPLYEMKTVMLDEEQAAVPAFNKADEDRKQKEAAEKEAAEKEAARKAAEEKKAEEEKEMARKEAARKAAEEEKAKREKEAARKAAEEKKAEEEKEIARKEAARRAAEEEAARRAAEEKKAEEEKEKEIAGKEAAIKATEQETKKAYSNINQTNANIDNTENKNVNDAAEDSKEADAADDDNAEREVASSLQENVESVTASRIPDDISTEEKNSNPIVGYLICMEGLHKGKSYNINEGRNFIGRSSGSDICLAGNGKISREKHAIITYDPRSKTFFFQPDESRNLSYLNDELVLGTQKMAHEDILFMGEEKFIFLKLTCDKLDWLINN